MKIHTKIILLLSLVFLIFILSSSGFIYYFLSNYAFADFYKRLEIRAAVEAKVRLEESNNISGIKEVGQEFLEELPNQKTYIYPTNKLNLKEELSKYNIPLTFIETLLNEGSGHFRISKEFYSGIKYKAGNKQEYLVIVSAENYFFTHHIAYLRSLLITLIGISFVWVFLFYLIVSKSLIQPIHNIIDEVSRIGSENLNLRLKTLKKNDALGKLTRTFNEMLNRLETSFGSQQNFISNASHELNTPLTAIIGEADFALEKSRPSADYEDSLRRILNAAEKLEAKTKALLMLAQTGFIGSSHNLSKIRVDQLLLDIKLALPDLNPKYSVRLDFSMLPESPEKLKIRGNQQLLHLAITNILINACKYSNYSTVYMGLAASKENVLIVIKDSGIGIPENELAYIFDPYYRCSNTSNYEGYGVGLPLSKNIIDMHSGQLRVYSKLNHGTTVEVQIPLGNYTI